MATTALSVETLVLVLRLSNMMATDWAVSDPTTDKGIKAGPEVGFMNCLIVWALRIRVTSSAEVRSAIDRKCRGTIVKFWESEVDEKSFLLLLEIWRKACCIGRETDILYRKRNNCQSIAACNQEKGKRKKEKENSSHYCLFHSGFQIANELV